LGLVVLVELAQAQETKEQVDQILFFPQLHRQVAEVVVMAYLQMPVVLLLMDYQVDRVVVVVE
jgi:hypothetical protein